jgi:hypothetical protein
MWLVIVFAVMVYALGHATKVWMRSGNCGSQDKEAARLCDSTALTPEEKQKIRDRAKERLKQESDQRFCGRIDK